MVFEDIIPLYVVGGEGGDAVGKSFAEIAKEREEFVAMSNEIVRGGHFDLTAQQLKIIMVHHRDCGSVQMLRHQADRQYILYQTESRSQEADIPEMVSGSQFRRRIQPVLAG